MTLIVEDGTAKTNSESYVTVAEFKTYHNNRGNDIESLENATIEQLLRKATDYMVARYRTQWRGYRKTATQALDFPRSFCYLEPFVYGAVGEYPYLLDNNIVPNEVKNACCELALRASVAALMIDETQRVKREKVDVIEVEYSEFGSVQTRYAQIDTMLTVYLTFSNQFQATVIRS